MNLRKDHNRKMVGSREFVRPEALKAKLGKNETIGRVWGSTGAMGDRETAVVRETSCRVPRVDRYPRAVESRSRPSGEGLRCLWRMAASIQGAGRLRAPDAQGAGRLRDPRCPLMLMERSLCESSVSTQAIYSGTLAGCQRFRPSSSRNPYNTLVTTVEM